MQNSDLNSPNSPEQPPATGNNDDVSTRTRAARRRIDATTIAEIARLCAKQLTESEACHRLDINPRVWFNWKAKNSRNEKFASLLEAFRADRIETLIDRIEKSADGLGMKQPDWRAAAHLLAIADVRRFSASNFAVEVTTPPAIVNLTVLTDSLNRIFSAPPALPPAPATKQIEDEKPKDI